MNRSHDNRPNKTDIEYARHSCENAISIGDVAISTAVISPIRRPTSRDTSMCPTYTAATPAIADGMRTDASESPKIIIQ